MQLTSHQHRDHAFHRETHHRSIRFHGEIQRRDLAFHGETQCRRSHHRTKASKHQQLIFHGEIHYRRPYHPSTTRQDSNRLYRRFHGEIQYRRTPNFTVKFASVTGSCHRPELFRFRWSHPQVPAPALELRLPGSSEQLEHLPTVNRSQLMAAPDRSLRGLRHPDP